MKRKLIITGVILFMLVAIGVKIANHELPEELRDVDKIVEPYDGDQLSGFEDMINSSENFKLGVNKQGKIIFADREKAYEQMMIVCKDGIKAVEKEGDLPKISPSCMDAYGAIGDQLSFNDVDISKQAAFIGVFDTIYSNSDVENYMVESD